MPPTKGFDFRRLRIHRALDTALPWPGADPEWTRIADLGNAEVGAYEIERLGPTRFRIVGLRVTEEFRRRGVGHWLLRHAVGTAESCGARDIEAPAIGSFFEHHGFRREGDVLRMTLTPE